LLSSDNQKRSIKAEEIRLRLENPVTYLLA
jgi:hypothetical protein